MNSDRGIFIIPLSFSTSDFQFIYNLTNLFILNDQSPKIIADANITSANLYFHFLPENKWDPYFKLAGGLGTEVNSKVQVNRFGAALGLRYHLNNNFFLEIEIENISANFLKNGNSFSTRYQNSGTYQDTNWKIGIGAAFLSGENTNSKPEGNPINTIGNPSTRSLKSGLSNFQRRSDISEFSKIPFKIILMN